MKVEEITTLDGLVALQKEWTDLLAQSDVRVIFLTPEWIVTWWRLFGEDESILGPKALWILTVRDGSRLVGLVPFMIRTRKRFGMTLRVLEFVGGGFGDYSDFIITGDRRRILQTFWAHIAKRKVWDIGILNDCSGFADHATLSEQCLPVEGIHLQGMPGEICPHVRISGSWDVFYEDAFKQRAHGGRRKKELRRLERQLADKGHVMYRVIHGRKDDPCFLEKMAAVQQCGAGAGNLFKDPSKQIFLDQFALETADKDWVRISTLEIDGVWVAYYFGFYYDNRYGLYNTSFVHDLASCSPGSLLMIHLLKEAFEEGMEEVDFMRGAEDFKFHWSNGTRTNTRLVFYRDSIVGRLKHDLYLFVLPHLKSLSGS